MTKINVAREEVIIWEAIERVKGDYNAVFLPTITDPDYKFSERSLQLVKQVNCELRWHNTFKGGRWYIVPLRRGPMF